MRLENRVALITGAARGVGKGIALRFASEGANVIVNYRSSREAAEKLCEQIRAMGRDATAIRADISSEDQVGKMLENTTSKYGKIDILINNAGIQVLSLVKDTPVSVWDEVLDINLKGVFLCCKHAIPYMIRNGKGRIINIAADAGKTGMKYIASFCASKFGVIGLTQALAIELAEHNITVNAICPGPTDTDMLYEYYDRMAEIRGTTSKQEEEALLDAIPVRRVARPEEIGNLAVYLASDDASYITGEAINISGGVELH